MTLENRKWFKKYLTKKIKNKILGKSFKIGKYAGIWQWWKFFDDSERISSVEISSTKIYLRWPSNKDLKYITQKTLDLLFGEQRNIKGNFKGFIVVAVRELSLTLSA